MADYADYLNNKDIADNLLIIKINKSYYDGISPLELYDVTRGCWRRKIESVKDAEYALSVSDSIVREVYKINDWKPSKEVIRETTPNKPDTEDERITFIGEIAPDDIRNRYLNKNVKNLYKWGEADPVKMVYKFGAGNERLEILDASLHIEFKSIYEAINTCVGTNYTGWMKACYPSVNGGLNYRMWFPKLAKIKDGQKESAAFDCLNTISDDWNQLVFEDLKRSPDYEQDSEQMYKGYDLIFAKDPDGGYLFRGVFIRDEDNSKGNKFVSKRIATKVRMIGNPADNIELLDSIDDQFWPSLNEYDPGISKGQYKELLKRPEITDETKRDVLLCFYNIGGQATCKQLSEKYGKNSNYYRNSATNLAKTIQKETDCPILPREEDNTRYWPVLFVGRKARVDESGAYLWKLRDPLKEAIEELINEGTFEGKLMDTKKIVNSLNTILYGPPGTGKTYSTASYAVSICDGKPIDELGDRAAVMARFEELKEEKRIVFTTFHQSYGYEEFIEGIKPKLEADSSEIGYTYADGTFKKFCNSARAVKVNTLGASHIKEQPRIWGMILGSTGSNNLKAQCFSEGVIRLGWDEVKDEDIEGDYVGDESSSWNGKHMVYDFKNTMEVGDIVVIEKTNKSIDAVGVITGDYVYDEKVSHYSRSRKVEWLAKDIDQDMVDYLKARGRQQMSRFSLFAFDYIGMKAISEILENNSKNLVSVEKESKPFVFIIDEINRGNISKIFGELITLIEDSKREGNRDATSAVLPYSGEQFSVPNNVYILGTMNTADRSIALMDTALRRRFSFIEMMPDESVLKGIDSISGEHLDVAEMLKTMNKRIEFLYDREHMIGHAFFIGLKAEPTIEKLASIFENSVIPLLQEYFYEDYQKIQLVLGDNAKKEDDIKFVIDTEVELIDTFKGDVEDIVDEKPREYKINKAAFTNIESYRQIM